MRRALFALAIVLSAAAILLWAAGVEWSSPFSTDQVRHWNGSDFRVVMGGAAQDEDRLRIGAVGDSRTALQSVALNGLEASEYQILRYRFEQFPHTLELSLVFRQADEDDVTVVSLPWPGDSEAVFDLGSVPEWKGRIVELAFAEYPTPQVVPPMQGFRPFTLVDAALSARSWRGDLAALMTDWLGYWPWSQRSVHALGRDTDTPRAQSLVLSIVLLIAVIAFWSALLLKLRGVHLLQVVTALAIGGWLLLDLQWHAGLRWRYSATTDLYAAYDWPQREQHAADSDILASAVDIKAALRDLPENTRVLVHSDSAFSLLRMIYHLLPMNVAVFAQAMEAAGASPLPNGTFIIIYQAEDWTYDAARRVLRGGPTELPADLIVRREGLLIGRYRSVTP
jgi:hypothetical protein